MPKGRRKVKNPNINPFKTATLLLQTILIRIGQAEIWLFKLLVRSPWFVVSSIWSLFKSIKLPTFTLYPLPFTLPRLRRGKGRPRKDWFLPYYLHKFKLYFKRKVTRKTKIIFAAVIIIFFVYIYTSIIFVLSYQLPSPKRLVSTH